MILDGKGRFVLHDKPAAFPFTDIVTGVGEGPVFDLSVDLEFYSGVPYLKAEHVEEMAKTLGMEYKVEAEPSSAEDIYVERLINGINDAIRDYHSVPALLGIDVPVYLSDPEPESPKPDSADSGKSAAVGNNSPAGKSDKPAIDKRSDKLSAGPNDGFDF